MASGLALIATINKRMLSVCAIVRTQSCINKTFKETSANRSCEASLDISVRSVWITGQNAILDVRVFNPLARRYGEFKHFKGVCNHRKGKEESVQWKGSRNWTRNIYTFGAIGGMSRECDRFYKRLCKLLADKRNFPATITMGSTKSIPFIDKIYWYVPEKFT